jgi:hypothetical protein
MQEVSVFCEEEIIEMAIANAEEVGHYAISGHRLDVVVHGFFSDTEE